MVNRTGGAAGTDLRTELVARDLSHPTLTNTPTAGSAAPYRHANDQPCYGCQSCFANWCDDDGDFPVQPASGDERHG